MELMVLNKTLTFPLLSFSTKSIQRPTLPSKPNHTHHQPNDPITSLGGTKEIHAHLIRTQFQHTHQIPWCPLQPHSSLEAQLNFLITSYIKEGMPNDALKMYAHMRKSDVGLDNFTVPSVLKACGQLESIQQGEEIHGFVLKVGLHWDVFVQNSLIQMYSECGGIDCARQVFEEMATKDVVSWSTIIRSYRRNSFYREALEVIREMLTLQVKPSEIAMINMLNLFADVGVWETARPMHSFLIKNRSTELIGVNIYTSLIDMYVKCGRIALARKVFNQMAQKSIASWTAVIAGCIRGKDLGEGLQLFSNMLEDNVFPNEITMISLLLECGSIAALEMGQWLHAYVLKNGFSMSVALATALLDMYAKCGEIETSRSLFDRIDEKDIMIWTAMISGYAKANSLNHAVHLFRDMKKEKVKPNKVTMASMLSLCAEAGALDLGKWVHACMDKFGVASDMVLDASLIDMYAKCGNIDMAYQIFSAARNKDICMWNAMISGLAMHGHGTRALKMFSEMEREGIKPNHITLIGVLHACSHSGLVVEGKWLFQKMKHDVGLTPKVEHYGCMVDLLSRAGLLHEAHEMINSMPIRPNIVVWGAFLSGCKLHKNAKLGEIAARQLLEMEPRNTGYNVLLSNIYAVEKRWNDVAEVRKMMKEAGINKAPGHSSIEVNGTLHEFVMNDDTHPEIKKIHGMISEMWEKLKSAGHVANTSSVLLNIDEEEKETALNYHSEKLAIAFALISTAPCTPIQVVKNLRICDDCHAAIKLLSQIYERLIIVRDRNRFHRFCGGSCSCGDYW